MSDLLVERKDGVLVLTMNRPKTLNALTPEARDLLISELRAEMAAPSVRAIVLTGAGRGFCSGTDLNLDTILARRYLIEGQMHVGINQVIRLLRDIPMPVIAAVNGVAAGVGFSLALAADIMVAAHSASFHLSFARIGASPDGGSVAALCRKIGEARTTSMAMLGGKMTATQAHDLGLVLDLAEDEALQDAAMALARKLAKGPTGSYAMIKRQVNIATSASLDEILRLEAACQARCFASDDLEEGVRAFGEKRQPVFSGK